MNNRLWYTRPGTCFNESLPIGMGRMGAMLRGDASHERIAMNEDSLWSGFLCDKNNKDAAKYLPEIRELMFSGRTIEAEEIINRYTLGNMCETYLPFCDVDIEIDGDEISEYKRELDLARGVFKMTCKKNGESFSEEAFASYPDELIVLRLCSAVPRNFKFTVSSKLRHSVEYGPRCEICGIAPESNLPRSRGVLPPTIYGDEKTSNAIRFCGMLDITTDGRAEGCSIYGAKSVEVRVSLATSFISALVEPKADARARALAALEKAKDKTYDELLLRHVNDHAALYSAFDISLGKDAPDAPTDTRLLDACQGKNTPSFAALLLKYGRYLTIASSRPGSHATNLQGIWNEDLHPAWCSNYTLDINLEMNHWGVEATGLGECALPLFDYISELSANGEKTAKLHYDCRGWVAHSSSDIWAYSTSCGPVNERRGCSQYAVWQGAGGWLCRHIYEHFLYTSDKAFMKKYMPIMLGAARFYLDFMVQDERGMLVTCPSLSPENAYLTDDGIKAGADIMPTMDREIISELFENCLNAAEAIDYHDETIDEIRSALPKIPPIEIAPDGSIMEWSRNFPEAEKDHRHVSHLYGLYPGHSISKKTPELMKAAMKTIDKRGYQGTGWGIVWKSAMCARLQMPDMAYSMLKLIFNRLEPDAPMGNTGGGLYDNLFDACPPLQIDGNFGIIGTICEMLCRDDGDEIELLPACPTEWSSGEVRGMRLRGGKIIDFKWENGVVTERHVR